MPRAAVADSPVGGTAEIRSGGVRGGCGVAGGMAQTRIHVPVYHAMNGTVGNEPLVINFAPTGLMPTRMMSPHVPLRPMEIIRDVCDAAQLGITIAHLHARNEEGAHSTCAELYREIIVGIRAACPDLVLCVSLSGRHVTDPQLRARPLRLSGDCKPDMGSLTLSSMNFSRHASRNAPDDIRFLCEEMLEHGIMPELEVFDLGMMNYARYLRERQLLRPPYYFNIILGNVASAQCDLLHAGTLLRDLPAESLWAFGGIGTQQLHASALAIAAGGGVRIGLEDNLFLDNDRRVLATNMQLLERVHQVAQMFGRPVMTPLEFRARMRLRTPPAGYGREAIDVERQSPAPT